MGMSVIGQWSDGLRFGRRAVAGILACLLVVPTNVVSSAQTSSVRVAASQVSDKTPVDHYYDPLPQETGAAGLKLMLRRLQTTGRLMQVDAHPDDEDGGMLTLEARGRGVSTLLMTLTRGEGGQNQLGSNLFDVLGVAANSGATGVGSVLRCRAAVFACSGFWIFEDAGRDTPEMARTRCRAGATWCA